MKRNKFIDREFFIKTMSTDISLGPHDIKKKMEYIGEKHLKVDGYAEPSKACIYTKWNPLILSTLCNSILFNILGNTTGLFT